ncbi:hypothetical protein [Nonomuraea sp. NPDC003201]
MNSAVFDHIAEQALRWLHRHLGRMRLSEHRGEVLYALLKAEPHLARPLIFYAC